MGENLRAKREVSLFALTSREGNDILGIRSEITQNGEGYAAYIL